MTRGILLGEHQCNAAKLLLDPCAQAMEGEFRWGRALFGHRFDDYLAIDTSDGADAMPKSVVVGLRLNPDDQPLLRHWADTIIYETHVKARPNCTPTSTPIIQGTYAGMADPAFIDHLTNLGVTAVELLSVHQFIHDQHLLDKQPAELLGLSLHLATSRPRRVCFVVKGRRSQVREFKQMVKALHAAGLEVILDVVYNHTGGQPSRTGAASQGIDNAYYYQLMPTTALLPGLHRHRQQSEHAAPVLDATSDGLAALLGAGDARRRLPLRPGFDARARTVRG